MPAEALDGEALRLAVIAAGPPPPVAGMLGAAEVRAGAGARWESSHGAVQGYAVTVALCAEDLAAVDASPSARDLLERAFAAAIGATPGHALTALAARWNRRGAVRVTTYREAATAAVAVTLDEGLRRYHRARGEGGALPDDLRLEEALGVVLASTTSKVARRERAPVEAALASMLGADVKVRWSVRSGG
ncbi:MAG: hypothetical protein JWM10_5256 [Myxococcaceae bacterium]|nr:hypothetical protein [Myxococcaceae bacterium]